MTSIVASTNGPSVVTRRLRRVVATVCAAAFVVAMIAAAPPAQAAPPPPFLIFADHTTSWFKTADEGTWARDQVVSRYTVQRSGHSLAAHSFGGTNTVYDRVFAARVAVGVLVLRRRPDEGAPPLATRLRLTTISGKLIHSYASPRTYVDADASARTGWLVTLEADQNSVMSLVYRQRLNGTGKRLIASFRGASDLVLSTSGTTVYVLHPIGIPQSRRARITAVTIASGARRTVRDLFGWSPRGLDVSPNGAWALVTFGGSGAGYPVLIPIKGGPSRRLPLVGEVTARFSPDSRQVYGAYPGILDVGTIGEVHWTNGTLRRIVLSTNAVRAVDGVVIDIYAHDLALLRP